MKNLFLIIFVASLSSCGLFKRSTKNTLRESSSTSLKINKDSIGSIVDKTKIVIREKADTTVTTKKELVEAEAFFDMDSLVNGLTSISNDLVEVRQTLDTNTKKLKTVVTLKPRNIPFSFDKTTIINKDITQQSKVNEVVLATDKKSSRKVSSTKEPAKMGIWLIAVIVVFVIIAVAVYLYFRKRRPF